MAHTTVVDASSAAGGGTVPSVRGFGRVDRRTSARNVGARKIRQELRARTREGLEPQVDVALAFCLVQRSHFPALPFFFAQSRIYVHGVDVRSVILGATCHMGSANYGTPCTRLGHVCKYKLGSPATFSSLPKNLRELRGDKQSRLKSLPTSNFVERLQLLLREGFTSHPVLNGHVPAPADGAPVMGN